MSQVQYQSEVAGATTSPLLAIVGRPNVGKSTLFNRLVGSRRAIVGDEPGITRDRLYGESEWRGHLFRIVDTGGILPDDTDFIPSEIFRQARLALDEAAAVIMVVDGRTELAAPDLELARLLQRTGKPLFLAVNKMDSDRQEGLTSDFHRLGLKEVFPVSAEHVHTLMSERSGLRCFSRQLRIARLLSDQSTPHVVQDRAPKSPQSSPREGSP